MTKQVQIAETRDGKKFERAKRERSLLVSHLLIKEIYIGQLGLEGLASSLMLVVVAASWFGLISGLMED